MDIKYFCVVLTIFFIRIMKIQGHGRTMDPVGRGSAWRKGFQTPRNYNDNESFCGGFTVTQIFGSIIYVSSFIIEYYKMTGYY